MAVNPKHVNTLCNLGMLHDVQGWPAEAQACYDRALAVDPEDVFTLYNLGFLHDEQGRPAEAQDCYDRALRVYTMCSLGYWDNEQVRPGDEQACYGCSDDQAWASAANHGGNACERRFYHVAIYGR